MFIFFIRKEHKNKNIDSTTLETTQKDASIKANKESANQKNATIEKAMNISLIFTTQRTPISGDIKASRSQVLSTLTPKLHFVSSISLKVRK